MPTFSPSAQKKKSPSSSMVFRLSSGLFFRRLRSLLSLTLAIILLFLSGMFFYVERSAGQLTAKPPAFLLSMKTGQEIQLPGCLIQLTSKAVDGSSIPSPAARLFPRATRDARRSLFTSKKSSSVMNSIRNMSYRISLPQKNGDTLSLTYHIGTPLSYFTYCILILLLSEIISLILGLRRDSIAISRTLAPLKELAEAAQTLNTKGSLSADALGNLTGTLDTINATHLDTRIPVTHVSDELRPLAEAVNEMLSRIDDAYRSQARFVSDASHELRTPIAVIQGYASLLTRWGTADPDTLMESVEAIKSEADSMKELVEQLLFLARGDNATMHLTMEPLDLTTIAEETVRELHLIDQTHQLADSLKAGAMIEADAGLMKQLLRILTDNSLKYTPAGGRISVSITVTPHPVNPRVLLTVSDEGSGISPEALPHIFDRFYRADESRNRGTGGTGLGLSIAKWIVDRHNGYFNVISREGFGTKITVSLPYFTSTPL